MNQQKVDPHCRFHYRHFSVTHYNIYHSIGDILFCLLQHEIGLQFYIYKYLLSAFALDALLECFNALVSIFVDNFDFAVN